jgi:methyl-accepting chemotaxis protein
MSAAAKSNELRALIPDISQGVGRSAVECSDVAGRVISVSEKITEQTRLMNDLSESATELLRDQAHVAAASTQVHASARLAHDEIRRSQPAVEGAAQSFSMLIGLVTKLQDRMQNLEAALTRVRSVSSAIETIAGQTNLLALNATLEAARAGEAGRGFAVVAREVKSLAARTRTATNEIEQTVADLTREAAIFAEEIEDGVSRGAEAQNRTTELTSVLQNLGNFVEEATSGADDIDQRSHHISQTVERLQDGLSTLTLTAEGNNEQLATAADRLSDLERLSNRLLNLVAHTDENKADRPFIDLTLECAREIERGIEEAIARGEVTEAAVFDTAYREIAGTDPKQYLTDFVDYADRQVRPIVDRLVATNERGYSAAIVNMDGFLPTHMASRSLPQGDDPVWNAEHCRNRRFFMDPQTEATLKSDTDFILETYRLDLGGGRYRPVKSIFAPIHVRGRRWGNLELAYLD